MTTTIDIDSNATGNEFCPDNDCEQPECHRCFPRKDCDRHSKCFEFQRSSEAYSECDECGHPYKWGDETHYPECSRINADGNEQPERPEQLERSAPNVHTLSNFRVEYVKPDYSRGHSFELRCAILADAAEFDGKTVRVFDVPDPDESQREIAQFACDAMNDAGKYARLLEAAKLLLAMDNCNYDRDQMRRSGGFDALRETVEALESERALASATD